MFRPLLDNVLAILGLAVASVGLLFIGWRTYRLQIIAVNQTAVQNCLQALQSKLPMDPGCNALMDQWAKGKIKSPYPIPKRSLEAARRVKRHLEGALQKDTHENKLPENGVDLPDWVTILISIASLAVVATIAVILMMQKQRRPRIYTPYSKVSQQRLKRFNWANYDGRDYRVKKHRPDENDDLAKLGQWLRSWQSSSSSSINTSSESVASAELRRRSTKRKLNVRNTTRDEEEAYEGLIELPSKEDTKIFFDPNTGEFIRLSPWKSQIDDSDESDDEVREGDTKEALAKMGSGMVALGAGMKMGAIIKNEIDNLEGDKINYPVAPQAGDATQGMRLDATSVGKSHTS